MAGATEPTHEVLDAETPNRFEMAARYAPSQPYFRGLGSNGLHNQELITAGLDITRIQTLCPPRAPDFPPGNLACPMFFSSMGKQDFETSFDGICWDYTMRREAQQILPYLYVGPAAAARNAEYLREEGITLLLGIRTRHPTSNFTVNGSKTAQAIGIEAEHIEINAIMDLTSLMPNVIRGINNHVCCCPAHSSNSTNGLKKVLVFCETGNEKAAAVVVGYLMGMLDFDLKTAVHNVQARRLSANFEHSQVEMLKAFETILTAQKDVANAQSMSNPEGLQPPKNPPIPKKRSFQEVKEAEYNSNMNEDSGAVGMEEDAVEHRQQPAPFCDKGPT